MPRVTASLPKQAAKKEEIQRSEHYYNNVTVVAMELPMSWAVICGCFTWSEILLFTLAFIWPSFCIPSVIVGISISVCTEVSVLSFGFELVDIVNHYWIEKKIKIAVVINLVCGRVHCYWDAVIIPEEQRYFSFFFFSFWTKWWTYYKFEKGSSFCWPFNLGNTEQVKWISISKESIWDKEPCVGPVSSSSSSSSSSSLDCGAVDHKFPPLMAVLSHLQQLIVI